MPFEIILKINWVFWNCSYTCICMRTFLPFWHAFWGPSALKNELRLWACSSEVMWSKRAPLWIQFKIDLRPKPINLFPAWRTSPEVSGSLVWEKTDPSSRFFCVIATSLTWQLLDCVLKKRAAHSHYRLPNRADLFTYSEKQHRHCEYHCNDHSQAHGQDEDVIFALVLVKQIWLHIVYGKDSKISVLAKRQSVHKNHYLTTLPSWTTSDLSANKRAWNETVLS